MKLVSPGAISAAAAIKFCKRCVRRRIMTEGREGVLSALNLLEQELHDCMLLAGLDKITNPRLRKPRWLPIAQKNPKLLQVTKPHSSSARSLWSHIRQARRSSCRASR